MTVITGARESGNPARAALARFAYIGLLLLATLTPYRLDADVADLVARLQASIHPSISARDAVDAARNITLFAGWGLVWALTSRKRNAALIAGATLTGLALSLGIESAQLFSSNRQGSILDLLTNGGGALIGAGATVLVVRSVRAVHGRPSFVGIPAFVFAASYGAAVLLEAVFPLERQETLPGAYGGPFRRLAVSLDQFEPASLWTLPVLDLVLFAPAGALAVMALVERTRDYQKAFGVVTAAGLGLMALAEGARGILGQRIELGPLLLHSAAILLGAWTAARWLPGASRRLRGAGRPKALLVLYLLLLGLWSWRPFDLTFALEAVLGQLSFDRLIPLQSHAIRVELFSVSDLLQMFLLLAPVGALLAVWPVRHRGALSSVFPGLYVALAFELGQVVIDGRYFDITDILLAGSGCLAGWLAIRRAGFASYGELSAGSRDS